MASELPWLMDEPDCHVACVPAANPLSNPKLRCAFTKVANLIVSTNAQTVANVSTVGARVDALASDLATVKLRVGDLAELEELRDETAALRSELEGLRASTAAVAAASTTHGDQLRGLRDYLAAAVTMDAQAARAHVATMNRYLGVQCPASSGGMVMPGSYAVLMEVPVQVGDMAAPFYVREKMQYTVRAPTPVEEVRRNIAENVPPSARVTVGGDSKPAHVLYLIRDEIEDTVTLVATVTEAAAPAGTEAVASAHLLPMLLAGKTIVSVSASTSADELRVVYTETA